ncbi:Retrovirus-related Pol polyprotein from transposon 17.6 [Vitis vinifera]|uniref:Retrovirus-related Pol polyprotein from transposon 17.6 n=1 Tax=Vitis vinifera TaxID=29760 RepID=A0A438JU86_VITVI|nr:Retrovirus-related Pol polyprotein from transposon 17.6 [Vitis vinifera]
MIQISEEGTHLTYISSLLTPEETRNIRDAFKQSHDVFAWAHSDMKGIHPSIVSHRLNVLPTARPVGQRVRRFHPDRQKIIRDEIDKLLEAKFIREMEYPDWLANVVVVDQIVDSTAGQEMLSFLDTFSRYHQISMAPTNEEKTTFITPHVSHTVEVYIDDIVVKSKTREKHALHLQEVFHLLRKYDMKLNPSKCAFGVSAGKFLGFMVSQRGIEVSPDQVKAVMETPPPRSKKELQRLTSKLVTLGRFIARFTDELRPFFLAIRKAGANRWTDNYQSAFEKIKHCLMQPPILSSPLPGEKLYLVVSEWAISAILFRCPSLKEQKPIYYVSRALADVETRYSKMELTALALRSAAQKLRPYFQAHPVVVLIDQPLRNILHKPDLTGRMLQWAIELSEYGIEFRPKLSMKGQTLRVDGASRSSGSEVGLLLQSPIGEHLEQAIRLGFPAFNNEAEYKVILSELDLALALSVSRLRVYSDSQLVVRHVQKEYKAKDECMARYLTKVRDTLQRFTEWTIEKIKRTENGRADAMASIVASLPIKEAILLPVHVQTNPSVAEASTCNTIEANQADSQDWTEAIIEYLRTGVLPKEPKQAHKTQIQTARFTLIKGHLYKRSFTDPYLRCLDHSEALYVLAELHEGWGMDIVGPLPAAAAQKKFLLVATDYFSKWVEAEAYASIKDKDLTKFKFCSELNIQNLYSTPHYPQSNRQVEATNKTLITALKKRLEQAKGKWVEELPGILWAYRTTLGHPTGNTPFVLTYGMDAVIPTEIGLPTIRTEAGQQDDANVELGRNLDWADEVREIASIRMADYQQRAAAHYNRKTRLRSFKSGTLVLRKVFENTVETGVGKFQANWEGPYIVSKTSESGAYHL